MDEQDLYNYALLTCLVGFVILGFLVLFVPLGSSTSNTYIDGEVLQTFPTDNGQVVIIKEVGETALFIESQEPIAEGLYRFYDPIESVKKDSLVQVSSFRKIST